MRILSKTTNDVGVVKQTLINTNNTSVTALHSLQKKLKTFRNELFNAILAEQQLKEHAMFHNRSEVRANNTICLDEQPPFYFFSSQSDAICY